MDGIEEPPAALSSRLLRLWIAGNGVLFLFSSPTPSSPISTNIPWFFNIHTSKLQWVISWAALPDFIWSCTVAHCESRGIKRKMTLAACSHNHKGLGSLHEGWKLPYGIRSKQTALQAMLSEMHKQLQEEPSTFSEGQGRFSHQQFFAGLFALVFGEWWYQGQKVFSQIPKLWNHSVCCQCCDFTPFWSLTPGSWAGWAHLSRVWASFIPF